MALILGIDVGASGIKGAVVDTTTGALTTERFKLPTPKPATPQAIADTFTAIVQHFGWTGNVGCGFPAIVKNGVAHSAANIHKSWIGINAEELLSEASGCPVKMLNDADAAGIAEVKYGFAKDQKGVAMLLTIGTGIGSALFMDGKLMPNTELGHLFIRGQEAEHFAADSVRKKEKLSWDEWAQRFNEYLLHLEFLFSPSVFILGGGASKYFEQYKHNFTVKAQVVTAQFLNNAGLIGAAYYAR